MSSARRNSLSDVLSEFVGGRFRMRYNLGIEKHLGLIDGLQRSTGAVSSE